MTTQKILIAGIGNELRQDDAFGMELVKQLKIEELPKGAKIQEVGIGGIHLVQELHENYSMLIMVDAVEWGEPPGHVYLREVESISDINEMPLHEKRAFLADMHYTNPMRALMLAKALKVIPLKVYMLGCEAVRYDDFEMGLSPEVEQAIPVAILRLRQMLPHVGNAN